MQTARLIATKNPEALAGAHRVQEIVEVDSAFNSFNFSKNPSTLQAVLAESGAAAVPKKGGAV